MKKKILGSLNIILLLCTILTGCTTKPTLTGDVMVTFFIGSIAEEGLSKINATIASPGQSTRSQAMTIEDNYAVCQFTNIPVGTWRIGFNIVTDARTFNHLPPNRIQVEFNLTTYCSLSISDESIPDNPFTKVIEAIAGVDQTVQPGAVVTLDGKKSYALNGSNLQYQWSIVTKPAGSTATLTNPTSVNPTFTADITGSYEISLVVNDGKRYSTPDKVSIFVCNSFARLPFKLIDAEYSTQLDKIIMVSANPNQLHIYDPATATDTVLDLPLIPNSVSIGPDGTHLAIGSHQTIAYVNLSTLQIEKNFSYYFHIADVILAGNGYIYVIPETANSGFLFSIEIASGHLTASSEWHVYSGTRAKLHPDGKFIYGTNPAISYGVLEKYNIQTNPAEYLYDSTSQINYVPGRNLWFSKDGQRIFVETGYVLTSSADKSKDMTYIGQLAGIDSISDLDHSPVTNQLAALEFNSQKLNLYSSDDLAYQKSITLPGFQVNDQSYTSCGRYIFFSNDGSKLFAITQAEKAAGLAYDCAVISYLNLSEFGRSK